MAQKTPKGSMALHNYKQSRNNCTRMIIKSKGVTNGKTSFLNKNQVKISGSNIGSNMYEKQINNHRSSLSSKEELIYKITPTTKEIKINYDSLEKSFKKIAKSGKSSGLVNVNSNDLQIIGKDILNGLAYVYESSVEKQKFPDIWKEAKATSIFKKGKKSKFENYRPISLLSIPSKILESICENINDHLNNHKLMNERLWGFRKNRSTETTLLHMTELWRERIDQNQVVGVLFLYF